MGSGVGVFLKEAVIPWAVYAAVWLCSVAAMIRAPAPAVLLYAIIAPLPVLWYPTHVLPLGSLSLTILVGSVLVGTWLQRTPADPRSAHGTFVLLVVLWSYLSLWNSSLRYGMPVPLTADNPNLREWKNFAMMTLLYFVGFRGLANVRQFAALANTVAGVLLFMAWREAISFTLGGGFSEGRRADGPFWIVGLNSNHFAAFITHYGLFILGVGLIDTSRRRRILFVGTYLATLYPLMVTYSRGAYLAMLFGLFIIGTLQRRWLLLGAVASIIVFWDTVLPSSVVDRIAMTSTAEGNLEESSALRLVVWDLAKQIFWDHPIAGIGYNGFWTVSQDLPIHNVHNYFLQTAAEGGLIGLGLLFLVFVKALGSGWSLYRSDKPPLLRGMGFGLIACVSAVTVTNLFGDRYSQLEVGSLFWLLLGAVDRARTLPAPRFDQLAVAADDPRPRPPGPGGEAGYSFTKV